jgi:hypothetical protein
MAVEREPPVLPLAYEGLERISDFSGAVEIADQLDRTGADRYTPQSKWTRARHWSWGLPGHWFASSSIQTRN